MYTYDRIGYLTANNEDEIADTISELGLSVISEACAAWYDRQVYDAALAVKNWVTA